MSKYPYSPHSTQNPKSFCNYIFLAHSKFYSCMLKSLVEPVYLFLMFYPANPSFPVFIYILISSHYLIKAFLFIENKTYVKKEIPDISIEYLSSLSYLISNTIQLSINYCSAIAACAAASLAIGTRNGEQDT